MKKIFSITLWLFFASVHTQASWKDYIQIWWSSSSWGSYKDNLVPDEAKSILTDNVTDKNAVSSLSQWIISTLFGVLAVAAIAVFIYLGVRLIMARGNEEEFSKVLKSFLFAILGLFVISAAYAIVTLVSNISI